MSELSDDTSVPGDKAFRGNQVRPTLALLDWHRRRSGEAAIEPGLPIVDAHHHLYGASGDKSFYRGEDLIADICDLNVLGTVYVEAYHAGWRTDGPEALRSLGEVERIVSASRQPLQTAYGQTHMAAGIVSYVDLRSGAAAADVLEAHIEASDGKLRGIRNQATYDKGVVGQFVSNAPVPDLFADASFRQGFSALQRHGLSFDAAIFHTQLDALCNLADAFPNVPVVLNHVGMPIGVEDYASRRHAVFAAWCESLRAVARRPNVTLKIGGMGMPVCGFGFEWQDSPAPSAMLAAAWRPFVEVCLDAFGPSRCMFESNFPVDKQSCTYVAIWNAFKQLTSGMSETERRWLFYRTACRTYRLPELENKGDTCPFVASPSGPAS